MAACRKIYFAGSIRAGRNDAEVYAKIVTFLRKHGSILTEHVGDPNLTEKGKRYRVLAIFTIPRLISQAMKLFLISRYTTETWSGSRRAMVSNINESKLKVVVINSS